MLAKILQNGGATINARGEFVQLKSGYQVSVRDLGDRKNGARRGRAGAATRRILRGMDRRRLCLCGHKQEDKHEAGGNAAGARKEAIIYP